MEEVFAGNYKISKAGLYAKVSQCVAVGVLSEKNGLAHIHCNTKLSLLEEFLESSFYDGLISVCGGVDAFVPQLGFISGRKNADRVLETICKKGLEKYMKEIDIYTDKVRRMSVRRSGIDIYYDKNY